MTARATQMRARFLQTGGHLRVVWWISNTSLRLDELVDDASDDLRDVLVDTSTEATSNTSWHVADADGSSWLVADLDVRRWTDPRRDRARRSTTPNREIP